MGKERPSATRPEGGTALGHIPAPRGQGKPVSSKG